MRVAVIGLGIVGQITLRMSPKDNSVGVDVLPDRVEDMRLDGYEASTDLKAVIGADLIFVCAGTPYILDGTIMNGAHDGSQVTRVLYLLKDILPQGEPPVVAIRSTVLPHVLPKEYPVPVIVVPEFLRMATAYKDAMNPPFVLVGVEEPGYGRVIFDWADRAGVTPDAERIETGRAEALLVKWASNWWHAAKVEFSNTVGDAAGLYEADSKEVMRIFMKDTILNMSQKYLVPGGPFGGACLPKDLFAGAMALRHHPGGKFLRAVAEANANRGGVPCPLK